MAYESLAAVYDKIMAEDVDYAQWAAYCSELFKGFGCPGEKIVDLGCGTGGITLEMQNLGWQMCGVDISPAMIGEAEAKFKAAQADIPLFVQDIAELSLPDHFDGALATFDTFNYLWQREQLLTALTKVNRLLNPGGVLVFDYNTRFKLADILGDNTYSYYSDEVVYIWENDYDPNKQLCDMQLTFFVKQPGGLYARQEERHRQRAYSLTQWKKLLKESGFAFLAAYDQLTDEKITKEEFEEKIFIVARKQD